MTSTDLSDYKNIYLQTAREYTNSLSSGCSKLSINSMDNEAINNIHISSHSLRSQSQVMGFSTIADLSGSIEKASDDILSKVSLVDEKFINLLKNSVDELNLELSKLEKTQ
jgi:chemotaxis protein histidine kinase CheA